MKLPLISVIIPIYNMQQYLPKCIKSVLEQSYTNLEIILVDDGSTDSSLYICNDFAAQDSRIIVLHKANGGQGSARNCALEIMCGEYVIFLDSDDSLKLNCIEFLYNFLIENELDVSACNIEKYDECGNFIGTRKQGKGEVFYDSISAIESMWTDGPINIGPWAKLFKSTIWRNVRFKECYSEDWASMHYVYENTKKIGYSYECKLNYLVRKDSAIRSFSDKKLIMMDIALNNIAYAKHNPKLIKAARQKAISVYFHLLFQLPNTNEYDEVREQLISRIIELRKEVLKYQSCTKKIKAAIVMSYLGFNFTQRVYSKIKMNNISY